MSENDQTGAPSAFELIGGEAAVRALVDRFYDLMDLEPDYAALRAVHGSALDSARDKLFWFLCGWLGGPQHYVERFGHPRLRARHLPFPIGIREREVDPGLAERLAQAFFGTADWMRNKGG